MSLSAEDRRHLEKVAFFSCVAIWVWMMIFALGNRTRQHELRNSLDDLCRAHYPECIVETKQ